jgi:hypothetical protein
MPSRNIKDIFFRFSTMGTNMRIGDLDLSNIHKKMANTQFNKAIESAAAGFDCSKEADLASGHILLATQGRNLEKAINKMTSEKWAEALQQVGIDPKYWHMVTGKRTFVVNNRPSGSATLRCG